MTLNTTPRERREEVLGWIIPLLICGMSVYDLVIDGTISTELLVALLACAGLQNGTLSEILRRRGTDLSNGGSTK